MDKETTEQTKLLNKIEKMNIILEQSETSLNQAQTEGQILENHLKTLRTKLERQAHQKLQLEEQTLEILQDQISTDQASHYRGKILRETQEKRRNMELTMFATEQQLSHVLFDLEKWKGLVAADKENFDRLTVFIRLCNKFGKLTQLLKLF